MQHIQGISRHQLHISSLEDKITADNPVRFIDAFVNHIDFEKLGFQTKVLKTQGRPSFATAVFLKLYLYGYLNGVRSSRRLEKECFRNIEVQWLLQDIQPNYHSIADFRKDNPKALKQLFKLFVSFLKNADLIAGETIAIDGTKSRAHNSKKANFNQKKIDKHKAYIDAKSQEYLDQLAQNDVQENPVAIKNIQEKIERLKQNTIKYELLEEQLKTSGEPQISTTDADARALLGIPTIVDRVAQQVIATELEQIVEKHFHPSSFGYRPNKSAHDALEECRINSMKYSWVIDLDIKGFFDNIDHELLLKAVTFYTQEKHILMYVKRWLNAPVQLADGTIKHPEGKGTPQGGVISPVLANIFMDIVFDKWITQRSPTTPFQRYADDIVIHCKNIKQALGLMQAIKERLRDCKLELNQEKSKIVYCRSNQKRQPPFKVRYQKFDFLGYTFKPRVVKERGKIRLGFSPAMSQKSRSRIVKELQEMNFHRWVQFPISKIAELLRLKLRGWINYYGKFRMSEMRKLFKVLHLRLTKWIRNKYRRFRKKPWYVGYKYLQKLSRDFPNLFEHWQYEGFRP